MKNKISIYAIVLAIVFSASSLTGAVITGYVQFTDGSVQTNAYNASNHPTMAAFNAMESAMNSLISAMVVEQVARTAMMDEITSTYATRTSLLSASNTWWLSNSNFQYQIGAASNKLANLESLTNSLATTGQIASVSSRVSILESMTNTYAATAYVIGAFQASTNFAQKFSLAITSNTVPFTSTNGNGSIIFNVPQVFMTFTTNTWTMNVMQTNTSNKVQFEKLQYDVATVLGGAGRVQIFAEINGAFTRVDNGGQAALVGLLAGTYNSAAFVTIPGQRWYPSNVVSTATITPLNRLTGTFGP